jgi:pimeloyl-ACP methyl ester carboxylesterase
MAAPLVCLHCSAAGGRAWAPLAAQLDGRLDVIAPDLLGYGPGDAWSRTGALAIADEVNRVERELERRAGDRDAGFHLFGHSYGGVVAMQLAMRRPERIRSLVLYEPVSFALLDEERAETRESAREIAAVARAVQDEAELSAHAAAARFVDYWSGPGAWAATGDSRRDALAARMAKVADEFGALFRDGTPTGRYRARLSMPILLLGGSVSPRPVRDVLGVLEKLLPHAERRTLEGLGHMGPLQQPARIAEVLAGWTQQREGTGLEHAAA